MSWGGGGMEGGCVSWGLVLAPGLGHGWRRVVGMRSSVNVQFNTHVAVHTYCKF